MPFFDIDGIVVRVLVYNKKIPAFLAGTKFKFFSLKNQQSN